MKILVKSEAERELMEKFMKELKSSDIIHEVSKDAKLTDDEGAFIFNGFFYSNIEIGDTESLIMNSEDFESVCSDCGKVTHGIRNRVTISLDEYISFKSNESSYWVRDSCL